MNTVKDLIFAQSLGSTKFIYFEDYTLKLPNETTCIILMSTADLRKHNFYSDGRDALYAAFR